MAAAANLALPAEITVLDAPPFLACGDADQGLVERLLERTARRQSDGHVGGLENALRRPDRVLEARGDEILERADAVDDRIGLPAFERRQCAGEILEGRIMQATFV